MNYPYANGAIQAIDERILTKSKLLKQLKGNPDKFIETLLDLGYGSAKSKDIEEIIVEETLRVKSLFAELSPQKKYTDLFFLAFDALNIKAFLKAKLFDLQFDVFSPLGIYSKQALQRYLDDENVDDLSKTDASLFKNINKAIMGITDARVLSARIDQEVFAFILTQGRFNQVLKTYFQAYIDVINIKTILRAKELHWDEAKTKIMLLTGGTITVNQLETLLACEADTLVRGIYVINEKLSMIVKTYFEKKNSQGLENDMDLYCLKAVYPYRFDAFGIGPIVYYFLKKQVEAKNIRMLYANPDMDGTELIDV